MVFRQRWGPCLNIGLSKIDRTLKEDPYSPSSCKSIGYGLLNAELFSIVRTGNNRGIPDAGHNAKHVA